MLCLISTSTLTRPAFAHPHVFIDGGVDFKISDGRVLEALKVTWLYDEFETLYILSLYGMSLNADGELNQADRLELVQRRQDWPGDFDGSAHLFLNGERVALEWPTGLDAALRDGRLEVTFTRALEIPLDLSVSPVEVAFYESTYFFDFSITNAPQFFGDASACSAKVIPFVPDEADTALQSALAQLSREETPKNDQVGALLADRMTVQCA